MQHSACGERVVHPAAADPGAGRQDHVQSRAEASGLSG